MMCSTRELELGDDHDGIIELPADAPVGSAFADYITALDDPVIDVASRPTGRIAWACAASRAISRRGSAR
jgi:phenylalanyl-tRNA synthetase beta chain